MPMRSRGTSHIRDRPLTARRRSKLAGLQLLETDPQEDSALRETRRSALRALDPEFLSADALTLKRL
jgi:hypothetical protein